MTVSLSPSHRCAGWTGPGEDDPADQAGTGPVTEGTRSCKYLLPPHSSLTNHALLSLPLPPPFPPPSLLPPSLPPSLPPFSLLLPPSSLPPLPSLPQRVNEKQAVIVEYELGRAIPNQQIVAKLERALGRSPGLPHLLLPVSPCIAGVHLPGGEGRPAQDDLISSKAGVQVGNEHFMCTGGADGGRIHWM